MEGEIKWLLSIRYRRIHFIQRRIWPLMKKVQDCICSAGNIRQKGVFGWHAGPYRDAYRTFCRAFQGSSYWNPRRQKEERRNFKILSRIVASIWSINFEGDLGFSKTDVRETVARLPGLSCVISVKLEDARAPHHRNITFWDMIRPRSKRLQICFSR